MIKYITTLVLIALIGFGAYWFSQNYSKNSTPPEVSTEIATTTVPAVIDTSIVIDDTKTVLGKSVEGRTVVAYHFGKGEKEIVFVGGMHGGYSWNASLVAFELKEYLEKNPSAVPLKVKVTVIPVLNPDGLNLVVGTTSRFSKADVTSSQSTRTAGRFNANRVDLNRNFDCDWKSEGTWQSTKVSGGATAFSEPESQAFRSYIESKKPTAVVVWYSAGGGVFPSRCGSGPSADSLALTEAYAKASGYKAFADFDFYEVTGDMPNWLAKSNIPAISVLLTTHEDTEWSKNQKGIEAIFARYAQ